MSSAKYNGVLVVLMLLAFVGQVMASTLNTCQKDMTGLVNKTKTTTTTITTETLSHLNHSAADPTQTKTLQTNSSHCNCCILECFCPMESCVSVTISTLQNTSDTRLSKQKIKPPALFTLSQSSPTIYRPPITTVS